MAGPFVTITADQWSVLRRLALAAEDCRLAWASDGALDEYEPRSQLLEALAEWRKIRP
jgi:hypothetical protein